MVTFLIIAAAIALQIFLTARKLSPFLSLLLVALAMGLALGMSPQALLKTIDAGVGSTLAGLALVIVLGAILGKVLEESGAAERIATTLVARFGERNIQWAMLLTGNYRCVTADGAVDIKDAVHADLEASRAVYNFVVDLCVKLGANRDDLVPFEKYAAAAQSLTRPSSAARGLNNGVPNIERADKLVQLIAAQQGLRNAVIDATVARVDARLEANRKKAAA